MKPLTTFLSLLVVICCFASAYSQESADKVSFANEVRPILAANCFGCHQGAIDRGGFVMTNFEAMLAGGDSEEAAIVPGKPDGSYLLEMISMHDGKAAMPPNDKPIDQKQVDLIKRWIEEGAVNDYVKPSVAFSNDNPPRYSTLPTVTAIDFSQDGKFIAVSGFNEVLLLDVPEPGQLASSSITQGNIVARFIGLSARISSLSFSPDGKRLAVAGGQPGEFGEVQVWDLATRELLLSKTVSYDTVFGVSWSPNGKMIAFGCTDTTLRAIDSESGEQVLFQGAHEDWLRDTVFSNDGTKLISVARDMSCKLTEVKTQRFIDNVTSITPGALKGGIAAVDRHPDRDEVLIGGSDGIPKLYRMERVTKRVIGDDANLIRVFPGMAGRIQSVAVAPNGKRFVAASSLNGRGQLSIYNYDFDTALPANIKAIHAKQVAQQNAEEKKALQEHITKDATEISKFEIEQSGIYVAEFHPNNRWIACGGNDGLIRFIESESGKLLGSIRPVVLDEKDENVASLESWQFELETNTKETIEKSPESDSVVDLLVFPDSIDLENPTDYIQLVVQAKLKDGSVVDVTRSATFDSSTESVSVDNSFVQAKKSGNGKLNVAYEGVEKEIPVRVELAESNFQPDFIHDINPVLTKLGCNAGTCHGSQAGKNGFKLSLRGYDPIYDIRSFTDDMGARRTNLASPSASLMLLKPTGQVPHEGGKLFGKNSKYYWLIHAWINNGAKLNVASPKVSSIDLQPKNPVLAAKDSIQQMRVVATFTNGTQRDVTRESFVEIGDQEIASVDGAGITALRRGEAPILARYEGAYAATTLTVMGNRAGFVWKQPEIWSPIDEMVASKWERMKIKPSGLCTDDEFIRRIYLDLTGLPPSAKAVQDFLEDQEGTQKKRETLIDSLIGNDEFVEHWSNKWADLMQVNRKYLGAPGARSLRDWIRDQVKTNRPYDEFVSDILTANGSNRENPQAAYYKIHRTPEELMENTTHLFLATRFNCNKCHDHPFERWTQDQYYEMAAFFAQVDRKADPAAKGKKIGGTAVEGAKPLYEIIADKDKGEIKHERTGQVTQPSFPFDCSFEDPGNDSRRAQLAAWITSPENPYFASSYVNRLWGYMMGVGLVEPIDDIRAGNPPSNPELLEYIRKEFVDSGFDTRHVIKLICKSRAYQLSIKTNPFNEDDHLNYSHAKARRLPAEVLFDSVHFVTGSQLKIPGVKPGTRAAALPDSGVKLPSGFLSTLGRPARESACECERANDLQLGSVLALVSGPDVSRAIHDKTSELTKLVNEEKNDRGVIDQLFLRILNRHASEQEISLALSSFEEVKADHLSLIESRNERQKIVDVERPRLEQQRLKDIEELTTRLAASIEEHDPELLKKEEQREKAIALATKELNEYKAKAAGYSDWKKRQLNSIQWHPILVSKVTTKTKRPVDVQSDRSVIFGVHPGKDEYTVYSQTDLAGVSAVRLELLNDDTLPAKGPGVAQNGNLVLTEFEVQIARPDQPDNWIDVPIKSAVANISQ